MRLLGQSILIWILKLSRMFSRDQYRLLLIWERFISSQMNEGFLTQSAQIFCGTHLFRVQGEQMKFYWFKAYSYAEDNKATAAENETKINALPSLK